MNQELDIFGTKWSISYVDKIEPKGDDTFIFGDSDTVTKKIRVATIDRDGNKFDKRTLDLTLLHEVVHAIFDEGAYFDSSSDEPLVEWTAKCLLSLTEQKFFNV